MIRLSVVKAALIARLPDVAPGLVAVREAGAMDEFVFQRTEEALHRKRFADHLLPQ